MSMLVESPFIPFVQSQKDFELLGAAAAAPQAVRVSLRLLENLVAKPLLLREFWVDPEVDGIPNVERLADSRYLEYIRNRPGSGYVLQSENWPRPDPSRLRDFVSPLLDACAGTGPKWLTVPQLPLLKTVDVKRMNLELAKATRDWLEKSNFRGQLILPVYFTHLEQYKLQAERKPRLKSIMDCVTAASASRIWVVDTSLADQRMSKAQTWLPNLVNLHTDLMEHLQERCLVMAGPYWGMNLVLWARGLVANPCIGLGRYQYHVSGGKITRQANERVAIWPLKRQVVMNPELRGWLQRAMSKLSKDHEARNELSDLSSRFDYYYQGNSRYQSVQVYRRWLDSLSTVPAPSRALALYQQLSSAYVLAKQLERLPEGIVPRDPAQVAQALMLVCL